MTYIPYEPPESHYSDTLMAFKVFAGPRMAAVIDADPLGPVNRIVRLVQGERRIKSALCRVPVGATVRLVRDEGSLSIREVFDSMERIWAARGVGGHPIEIEKIHPPGWRIEVDGRTVLAVTDAELRPPYTPPPPPPLWHRMREALRHQLRADADAIAKRLGYHRDGQCEGDDDW